MESYKIDATYPVSITYQTEEDFLLHVAFPTLTNHTNQLSRPKAGQGLLCHSANKPVQYGAK